MCICNQIGMHDRLVKSCFSTCSSWWGRNERENVLFFAPNQQQGSVKRPTFSRGIILGESFLWNYTLDAESLSYRIILDEPLLCGIILDDSSTDCSYGLLSVYLNRPICESYAALSPGLVALLYKREREAFNVTERIRM